MRLLRGYLWLTTPYLVCIDLDKLNASQGVLFEIGLSFEVSSIEMIKGQMVYTLKALVN